MIYLCRYNIEKRDAKAKFISINQRTALELMSAPIYVFNSFIVHLRKPQRIPLDSYLLEYYKIYFHANWQTGHLLGSRHRRLKNTCNTTLMRCRPFK